MFFGFKDLLSFYIRPIIVDVHYLKFLSDYSKLTKSEFIIDFYKQLVENYLLMILFRNERFVKEILLVRRSLTKH